MEKPQSDQRCGVFGRSLLQKHEIYLGMLILRKKYWGQHSHHVQRQKRLIEFLSQCDNGQHAAECEYFQAMQ